MVTEKEVQKLAEKAQLEIKKGEMDICLATLNQLEKLLENFRKVNLPRNTKPLTRIKTGYLTKKDLEILSKELSEKKTPLFPANQYLFKKQTT